MIYKIIHSDFEIDLRNQNIDYTEQNQWFVDGITINYTLPLSLTLTQELDEVFGMISHINSFSNAKSFDVKLHKMDKIFDAIIYIESIYENVLELSIKYGFETYPNFAKNLRQLPLEDKQITNLREDALTVKPLVWPETNYKYPAAHLPEDVLDNTSNRFDFFENIINLFEDGQFVENIFDEQTNDVINRTIMQPFPYVLHLLIKGFQDAGFELIGDILEDEQLKKVLIGSLSDYYTNFNSDQEDWVINSDYLTLIETTESGKPITEGIPEEISDRFKFHMFSKYFDTGWFYEQKTISNQGRFKIAGNINIRRNPFNRAFLYILIDGEVIKKITRRKTNGFRNEEFFTFNYNFDVNTPRTITIYTQQGIPFSEFNEPTTAPIIDFTITQLASLENEELIPSIIEANRVRLNQTLPNKKFGDLVKAVMAWRNMNITIDVAENKVIMNKIAKTINLPTSQDLSFTEIKKPQLEFNEEKSYLLKFTPKQDDQRYDQLLFSRNGPETKNIKTNENTEEINIELYPLLNKTINGINTSTFEDDAQNDIAVFLHDTEQTPLNTTHQVTELLIPQIFENDYEDWLDFRLFSKTFKWKNVISVEEALLIDIYQKTFAYNQVHYIKQLIVRLSDKDFAEIEIETES